MSDTFEPLIEELERWQAADRTARLWWRDDDLTRPSPALDRLLRLGQEHRVALHLAVIPARAEKTLASVLPRNGITVFQHGYDHIDRAPEGEGAWELGLHRPQQEVLDDLARGKDRLETLLAAWFVPVLVPPWCRLAAELIPLLPDLGYTGLSCDGRDMGATAPSLRRIDAELDPVDWKRGAAFKGARRMVAKIVTALAARRTGETADEPLGLNTHHLDHDAETWQFLGKVAHMIDQHPAAEWLDVSAVFRQQSGYDHQD